MNAAEKAKLMARHRERLAKIINPETARRANDAFIEALVSLADDTQKFANKETNQ